MTIQEYFTLSAKRKIEKYKDYSHYDMIYEVYEWKSVARTLWIILIFVFAVILYMSW